MRSRHGMTRRWLIFRSCFPINTRILFGLPSHLIRVSREMSKSQKAAYRELLDRGIGVNLHYIPVYLQPFYADLGFERGHCPEAESYFKETLSIPMFAGSSSRIRRLWCTP